MLVLIVKMKNWKFFYLLRFGPKFGFKSIKLVLCNLISNQQEQK
jgi:hypothetical protein